MHQKRIKSVKIKENNDYFCGKKATENLISIINNNKINCIVKDKDRYKRLIAVCFIDKKDINGEMVKSGWALAYREYSEDYINHELYAKKQRKGIWEGGFIPPWQWRKLAK